MKKNNYTLTVESLFYTVIFLVFILFLALFTNAMTNVIGAFETEAFTSSIAQL
ncbi:hypothetical protein [uncultured Winogradskyella sp.]|jgi:hypothetical protein|uniref:hypothetical protein n=1 Tax=uncultured Winogradskyella sp. TaxID=395353 RepID=UPI002304144F|nr:hypothetical protein [Winogradskyella sp.]MDA8874707.1 hypothetical protein [Winogradskyella sp.]